MQSCDVYVCGTTAYTTVSMQCSYDMERITQLVLGRPAGVCMQAARYGVPFVPYFSFSFLDFEKRIVGQFGRTAIWASCPGKDGTHFYRVSVSDRILRTLTHLSPSWGLKESHSESLDLGLIHFYFISYHHYSA